MTSYSPTFPDFVVSNYARKLYLISETLGLLDQARTKLAACEGERFQQLAEQIEEMRLEILKTIKEVLP